MRAKVLSLEEIAEKIADNILSWCENHYVSPVCDCLINHLENPDVWDMYLPRGINSTDINWDTVDKLVSILLTRYIKARNCE